MKLGRSRHGLDHGRYLGRVNVQHIFLSTMIRKFKSGSTLGISTAVYKLSDTAAKAPA
jgi:hypothetical protein